MSGINEKPNLKRKRPRVDVIHVQKKQRIMFKEEHINSTLDSTEIEVPDKIRKPKIQTASIPQSWDVFIPRKPKRKIEEVEDLSEDNVIHKSRKKQKEASSSPLLNELADLSNGRVLDQQVVDVIKTSKTSGQRTEEINALDSILFSKTPVKDDNIPKDTSVIMPFAEEKNGPATITVPIATPVPSQEDAMHESPDEVPAPAQLLVNFATPNAILNESKPPGPPTNAPEFGSDFKFNFGSPQAGNMDTPFAFGETTKSETFVFGGTPTAAKTAPIFGSSTVNSPTTDSKPKGFSGFNAHSSLANTSAPKPALFENPPHHVEVPFPSAFVPPSNIEPQQFYNVSTNNQNNEMEMDDAPASAPAFERFPPPAVNNAAPPLFATAPANPTIFGQTTTNAASQRPIRRRR